MISNIVISAEKREDIWEKCAARKIQGIKVLIPGIIIEKEASVPIKLES